MTSFQYGSMACSCLAVLAIISSLLVIGQASSNPVNAVLWLIVAFVAVACYLITAGLAFIGLSYIIVYVGAIAVLFLFVVMMLNLGGPQHYTPTHLSANTMTPIAFIIGAVGGLVLVPLAGYLSLEAEVHLSLLDLLNSALYGSSAKSGSQFIIPSDLTHTSSLAAAWVFKPAVALVAPMSQVQALGLTLYTNGALWLLLLSVLLMLAMIVPLALAFTS